MKALITIISSVLLLTACGGESTPADETNPPVVGPVPDPEVPVDPSVEPPIDPDTPEPIDPDPVIPINDLDGDGIADETDADIDGDGVENLQDAFSRDPAEWADSDSDGTGNNADLDDDNDGYPDALEQALGTDPLDALSAPSDLDSDGTPDALDDDRDGDGVDNITDAFPDDAAESLDTDNDGTGNNVDTDDDNDGFTDDVERTVGTDPLDPLSVPADLDGDGTPDSLDSDRDGDGVDNSTDAFPDDATESLDTDNDGTGNNADTDDDNDSFNDDIELTVGTDPLDSLSVPADLDGDGTPDLLDIDRDGDGVDNTTDAFPDDATESLDTDNDGIGNNTDTDDDNDGFNDDVEQTVGTDPLDLLSVPSDLDGDGTPDSLDSDRDGDGVENLADAFPDDATESVDTDNDGIGNNADTDDDNDRFNDDVELTVGTDPLDPLSVPADLDGDGTPDSLDSDRDGDGVGNTTDAFPDNATESLDTDNDGIGNNADADDDNDSFNDDVELTVGTDPLDPLSVPADFDGDGTPDALDDDRDGDGVENLADAFPDDATESVDTDSDGIGNNADSDDDNDGFTDDVELSVGTDPLDPLSVPADLDGDSTPDALDDDRDGDGVDNIADAFPDDPTRSEPETTPSEPTALDTELLNLVSSLGFDPAELTERVLPKPGDPLVELGKELFFSRSLSFGDDVACATCHDPRLAGTDNLSLPVGVGAHEEMIVGPGRRHDGNFYIDPKADFGPNVGRNSPTTFNIAFYDKAMFWDGRVEAVRYRESLGKFIPDPYSTNNGEGRLIRTPDSFANGPDSNAGANLTEAQARFPVTSVTEMRGFDSAAGQSTDDIRANISDKLLALGWEPLFRESLDDYVSTTEEVMSYDNIARALGEYQRSQVALDNSFFSYLAGDYSAISQTAVKGAIRFFDIEQNGCVRCHEGAHFSDEGFYSLATPQIGRGKNAFRQDFGRYNISRTSIEKHSFRTPSLLNVALTHPYMHAGTVDSLEDAIRWHFDPLTQLVNYDFTLESLPQYQGLGVDGEKFANLADSIGASHSKQKSALDYKLKFLNFDTSETAVTELAAFLRSLSSDCLQSSDCVRQWMPDPLTVSPDGNRLEPELAFFDNSELFIVVPPEAGETVAAVFPDLSDIGPYPTVECQAQSVASPIEMDVIFGFRQADFPIEERIVGTEMFSNPLLYVEPVLMSGAVASADLDGDCDFDVIIDAGRVDGLQVLLNQDGVFEPSVDNYGLNATGDLAAFSLTDINGDGWPDLMVGHLLTANASLWLNNGAGQFLNVTDFGFSSIRKTHNFAFHDVDADGDLDMFTANWDTERTIEEPHLWLNDGRGFFSASAESGMEGSFGERDFTLTPNFADMNGDHLPDLLSASDFLTNQIFQGNGDGTFTNATDLSVITDENAMGAALGDYDNDGDLDWFVSNIYDAEVASGSESSAEGNWGATGNRLYRNDSVAGSNITLADVTETSGVRDGAWAWGACMKDFDNDGWLDIYQINGFGYGDGTYNSPLFSALAYLGINSLFEFVESDYRTGESALYALFEYFAGFEALNAVMGNIYVDPNDMSNDINLLYNGGESLMSYAQVKQEFYGKPARLFINNQDGSFTEEAFLRGANDRGEGRGLICNDFDRDGDVDILIINNVGAPTYYENHFRRLSNASDNFINVQLRGVAGNRFAYGAKVTLTTGELQQYREMRFENNYLSNNAPELHFGLADAELIDEIRVRWPDGSETVMNDVDVNQFLVLSHP